jgi:hypothetical protein
MCKWSKSNQCFQVVATLHPQAPQAPQARQAFLVGSQLDGIPTIDISELRRQLLTDPLATHGFRPFSCLAKPFHWRGRSSSLIRPKNVTWNIKIPKMSLGMPEAFHQRQEKGCILHLLSHTRLAAACNWVTIAAIVANRLTQEGVLRANLEPMKSYAFQDVSSFILRMIVPIVSNCIQLYHKAGDSQRDMKDRQSRSALPQWHPLSQSQMPHPGTVYEESHLLLPFLNEWAINRMIRIMLTGSSISDTSALIFHGSVGIC